VDPASRDIGCHYDFDFCCSEVFQYPQSFFLRNISGEKSAGDSLSLQFCCQSLGHIFTVDKYQHPLDIIIFQEPVQ
jgi:hypothetical protein